MHRARNSTLAPCQKPAARLVHTLPQVSLLAMLHAFRTVAMSHVHNPMPMHQTWRLRILLVRMPPALSCMLRLQVLSSAKMHQCPHQINANPKLMMLLPRHQLSHQLGQPGAPGNGKVTTTRLRRAGCRQPVPPPPMFRQPPRWGTPSRRHSRVRASPSLAMAGEAAREAMKLWLRRLTDSPSLSFQLLANLRGQRRMCSRNTASFSVRTRPQQLKSRCPLQASATDTTHHPRQTVQCARRHTALGSWHPNAAYGAENSGSKMWLPVWESTLQIVFLSMHGTCP